MQKALPTAAVPFLRIHVLFTNPVDTCAALRTAIAMASGLDAEIAVIVTQIVPFTLPLDDPPVPLEFVRDRIRRLAETVSPCAIELKGCIYLCRNPIEALLRKLPAHSLTVLGIRPHWPFGKSKRLARALRRSGHAVILANHG